MVLIAKWYIDYMLVLYIHYNLCFVHINPDVSVCSVMAVPATVLYFTCYDQLRAVLSVKMGDYAQMAPLIAGALARGKSIAVSFLKRSKTYMRTWWTNVLFF